MAIPVSHNSSSPKSALIQNSITLDSEGDMLTPNTAINLTKLDVLDSFPLIQVAIAYITPRGERLEFYPDDLNVNYTVEYATFEGWQQSTKGVRTWSELPLNAQQYIEYIETSIGTKIVYIGTGQDREDVIYRNK